MKIKNPPKLPPFLSPEVFREIAIRYQRRGEMDYYDFFYELAEFYEQDVDVSTLLQTAFDTGYDKCLEHLKEIVEQPQEQQPSVTRL